MLDVRTPTETYIAVTIGAENVPCNGRTLLRRLQPGPHRLFVAAERHQSAIVDVVVPTTGRAKVTVELPPR